MPRDEFIENNHWPLQLNIREARRMVSDFVLTENEVSGRRMSVNPVGMSSYSMESQNVQRIIASDKAGNSYVQNEGDFKITLKEPFGLPYESMVPRKNECLNLLVPVCLSASHVTIGSISREPIIMILGQSAATASVLSIDLNCSVQDLPYEILGTRLIEDGQILEIKKNHRVTRAMGVSLASLGGVVVDGSSIELTGNWSESTSLRPFVGNSYFHDGNGGKVYARRNFPL